MQAPMTRKRKFILVLGIACLGALSYFRLSDRPDTPNREATAERDAEAALSKHGGEIFGTTFAITARLPKSLARAEFEATVDGALEKVDWSMSTYKPDSELSKLNDEPPGVPVPVSPELLSVLILSKQIHEQTGGAFDITVGPLVAAWGFGAKARRDGPEDDALASLMQSVGTEHLLLDVERSTVEKARPGMSIDLSAVAKGYGVDQVSEALAKLGIGDYLVEVGGEVRAHGRPTSTRNWRLGIERPDPGRRQVFATVELQNAALATSGDYRNFRSTDQGIVSHTLDPRTGRPTNRRTASVSVIRPTAAEADALATALGVLDPEKALSLATSHGWAVLLLLHDSNTEFAVRTSPAWEALNWNRVSP